MSALSVAVIGGGIGGLSAALHLLKAGHDVQVYEQTAQIVEVGLGHLDVEGADVGAGGVPRGVAWGGGHGHRGLLCRLGLRRARQAQVGGKHRQGRAAE